MHSCQGSGGGRARGHSCLMPAALRGVSSPLRSLAVNTLSREEVQSMLRRGSSGFSRGASRFRGVTKHHQQGKWEARIGRVDGSKYKVSAGHPRPEARYFA